MTAVDTGIDNLTEQLKARARQLGFVLAGVTPAVTPARLHQFHRWLDSGYAGQMLYLENRREAYHHPRSILDGCKSLLMLGMPYLTDSQSRNGTENRQGFGKVARYAQSGLDYHDVIREKLKLLRQWLVSQRPGCRVRGVVDTAPLLEREFAEAAGLGWVGKNTLLLNRQWGSYFFLAALLTDVELSFDQPPITHHCGTCTACLDHCPTQALIAPFQLDATRCLSYWTIESQELPTGAIAQKNSGWVFGCDICQEVCPWNQRSLCSTDSIWQVDDSFSQFELSEVLQWDEAQFESLFRYTPMWRARRRGLLRNAILVAGSQHAAHLNDAIVDKLSDSEPLIRAAAAWALGEMLTPQNRNAIGSALLAEKDELVLQSMNQALCKTAVLRRE